jgi:hypothetical protein
MRSSLAQSALLMCLIAGLSGCKSGGGLPTIPNPFAKSTPPKSDYPDKPSLGATPTTPKAGYANAAGESGSPVSGIASGTAGGYGSPAGYQDKQSTYPSTRRDATVGGISSAGASMAPQSSRYDTGGYGSPAAGPSYNDPAPYAASRGSGAAPGTSATRGYSAAESYGRYGSSVADTSRYGAGGDRSTTDPGTSSRSYGESYKSDSRSATTDPYRSDSRYGDTSRRDNRYSDSSRPDSRSADASYGSSRTSRFDRSPSVRDADPASRYGSGADSRNGSSLGSRSLKDGRDAPMASGATTSPGSGATDPFAPRAGGGSSNSLAVRPWDRDAPSAAGAPAAGMKSGATSGSGTRELGDTGYGSGTTGYRPGDTGYNPGRESDYRPGNTGYNPPNTPKYQSPAGSYVSPADTGAGAGSGDYRPGSTSRYTPRKSALPEADTATSGGTVSSYPNVDSDVTPTSYPQSPRSGL